MPYTLRKLHLQIIIFIISCNLINLGLSVRCYQCSSNEDRKHEDNCGAYSKFERYQHVAVECNSEESHVPGSFCMKITKQGRRGFIWDGRWRQVIRRCASIAETGVTGVCNWGVEENGDYWEECYCSEDECNAGFTIKPYVFLVTTIPIFFGLFFFI